jgi:hypothetical protein
LLDIYQNLKNLGGDNNKAAVFTLRTTINDTGGSDEFLGFVKPIKEAVRCEVNAVKTKITDLKKDVDAMKKKLESDLKKCLDKL